MSKSVGGMQTSAVHPSIICKRCGKSAFSLRQTGDYEKYSHFTKKGVVHHWVRPDGTSYVTYERHGAWGFTHLHPDLCHEDDRGWRPLWCNDDKESWVQYCRIVGNIHDNPELLT